MLKILYIALGFGAIGAGVVTAHLAEQHNQDRTEKAFDGKVSASGAHQLDIKAAIASVELETGNYSDVSVHAVRWTKRPDSPAGKRWMNESHFSVARVGDSVTVKDGFDDSHGKHNADEGDFDGGLEIHIKAPAGMNLDAHVGAGTIDPSGDLSAVAIRLGAGAIHGKFSIDRTSDVHLGAGEVDLKLQRSQNVDVDAHTGVGEIKGLPSSGERAKGMHIGDSRSGRFGSGGSTLSIHVGAGSIKIDSGDEAKPLEVRRDDEGSADVDVAPIVSRAMSIADQVKAGKSRGRDDEVREDRDEHDGDVDVAIEQAMKGIGPMLDKTLANIGPDLDKAMRQIQPDIDREMANIGPEIDRAMREARPQIDKEMKDLGPQIREALKSVKPELERARREVRENLSHQLPEMERSLKQAEADIDRATRDLDHEKFDDKEMGASLRNSVRQALKAAREAIHKSMEASRKALKDSKNDTDKNRDND